MARATASQLLVVAGLAAAMLLAAPRTANAADAPTCTDLKTYLVPCLDYAYGKVSDPSQKCCDGVKKIADREQTVNQTAACSCLKKMVVTYDLNRERAASLPSQCGVSLYWPISASVDCKCAEVKFTLTSCAPYLFGSENPSWGCCNAIKKIADRRETIDDQRDACVCLRKLVTTMKSIIPERAAELPLLCGVSLPYSINATANCENYETLINVA